MWDLIVSVPDHCLSFYLREERIPERFSIDADQRVYTEGISCLGAE